MRRTVQWPQDKAAAAAIELYRDRQISRDEMNARLETHQIRGQISADNYFIAYDYAAQHWICVPLSLAPAIIRGVVTPAAQLAAASPALARSLTIEIRNNYGRPVAYPVDRAAQLFADIAGSTTLTRATLDRAAALGFEIISMANADWRRVA